MPVKFLFKVSTVTILLVAMTVQRKVHSCLLLKKLKLRLLQTFAGLHWSIFFFVKKMKVRQLRYHFPKKVSKNIKTRASY